VGTGDEAEHDPGQLAAADGYERELERDDHAGSEQRQVAGEDAPVKVEQPTAQR
jgi:hypothetical protein